MRCGQESSNDVIDKGKKIKAIDSPDIFAYLTLLLSRWTLDFFSLSFISCIATQKSIGITVDNESARFLRKCSYVNSESSYSYSIHSCSQQNALYSQTPSSHSLFYSNNSFSYLHAHLSVAHVMSCYNTRERPTGVQNKILARDKGERAVCEEVR